MDFSKLLKERHSVREFKTTAVEDGKLQRILEAANSAPSAGNLQAYELLVVADAGARKELAKICYEQDFITQAPLSLIFFANPKRSSRKYGERGASLYCIIDASIAASYAQLAIADEGLGTVWVGAFHPDELKKFTNAPSHLVPVAVLPVGYPAETPEPHGRRKLDDVVKRERF